MQSKQNYRNLTLAGDLAAVQQATDSAVHPRKTVAIRKLSKLYLYICTSLYLFSVKSSFTGWSNSTSSTLGRENRATLICIYHTRNPEMEQLSNPVLKK